MKKNLSLIITCLLLFFNALGQYQSSCNYQVSIPINDGQCLEGDWTLVFEDEFNGTQIDNSKWDTYYGYGDRCHADEPQVYLDDNVIVNNGILSLLFKEQPGSYESCGGTTKWREYSSGMIFSKSSYLYGIFEAEIKIPNGTGFWPAFWLWGPGGEIDVFEFYDDETAPEFSTHKWSTDSHYRCTYTHNGSNYSSDYYTYTVYWDKFFIAFYINGDLKYVHWLWYTILGQSGITCNNLQAFNEYIASKSFPSHQDKEHIIINLAGQVNSTPGPLNSELNVKYVRAWQLKENVCIDKTVSQFSTTLIEGKSITVDGNIVVGSGENIKLTADNRIVLKPGLNVKQGAKFKSEINPNLCSEPLLTSAKSIVEPKINFAQIDSLKNVSNIELIENNPDIVHIYPNPVTNKLNVVSGKGGKLFITDISGKILITTELNANFNLIDMDNFNVGLYIVKLIIDDKIYIKKIIKQ